MSLQLSSFLIGLISLFDTVRMVTISNGIMTSCEHSVLFAPSTFVFCTVKRILANTFSVDKITYQVFCISNDRNVFHKVKKEYPSSSNINNIFVWQVITFCLVVSVVSLFHYKYLYLQGYSSIQNTSTGLETLVR